MTFKVDDKVRFKDSEKRCIKSWWAYGPLNADYYVLEVWESGLLRITAAQYGSQVGQHAPTGLVYSHRLELAEPVITKAQRKSARKKAKRDAVRGDYIIVLRKEDGSYAPADTPRQFTSEYKAAEVAKKLALEHNQEFVVFQNIGSAEQVVRAIYNSKFEF